MLKAAENGKSLVKDGKPFFWLADTCWSAFTNISDAEWEYYLNHRKVQGFNVLQINILPQWDASGTDLNYHAFDEDYLHLNEEYFAHAREMCIRAKEAGFELALVVLWSNFVPGTWASKIYMNRLGKELMPFEAVENYVRKVHETFSDLEPVYVISGDTDFPTEETVAYYLSAARLLKSLAPDLTFTAHIKGRFTDMPIELSELMDVMFYQSGHNSLDFGTPYKLSEEMQAKYPGKPLINSEPCYEQMGYSGGRYGRWGQFEIRRAAWQSVLSGASAGITYGAAGIYSWHKLNVGFSSGLGEGFDTPKPVEEALQFKGAWDYGYLRQLIEKMDARNITPRQDILLNNTEDIRVAEDSGRYLVYMPSNTKLKLQLDLSDYQAKVIDLESRYMAELSVSVQDGVSVLPIHPFDKDVLVIFSRH